MYDLYIHVYTHTYCTCRLVTAAINGEIKIWNFNNGHCLLTLNKGNLNTVYMYMYMLIHYWAGNHDEVCGIKFVAINQIKYVILLYM